VARGESLLRIDIRSIWNWNGKFRVGVLGLLRALESPEWEKEESKR
jgi:hypothetical protein